VPVGVRKPSNGFTPGPDGTWDSEADKKLIALGAVPNDVQIAGRITDVGFSTRRCRKRTNLITAVSEVLAKPQRVVSTGPKLRHHRSSIQREGITLGGSCDLVHALALKISDSSEVLCRSILTSSKIMPYILDLLYREYCRARLAEMRKQLLLISPRTHGEPVAIWDAKDAVGASSDRVDVPGSDSHRTDAE
jgi:hypothetical protein